MFLENYVLDNVRYDGNNYAVEVGTETFKTVTSLLNCKELCENNTECLYFNYNKDNKKCFPRSGMGERAINKVNFVFGHKYVQGENICHLSIFT